MLITKRHCDFGIILEALINQVQQSYNKTSTHRKLEETQAIKGKGQGLGRGKGDGTDRNQTIVRGEFEVEVKIVFIGCQRAPNTLESLDVISGSND